jgi:DNA polymerase (family 10)
MLGRRAQAPIDLARLTDAAARGGTFLEVNAQPRRLDLDAEMAASALAAGVRLTIGSDAHSGDSLDLIRFGVRVARRAGTTPDRVGNTWTWEELAAHRAARLRTAGAAQ